MRTMLAVLLVVGCGGEPRLGPDAEPPMNDGGFVAAPHPALPRIPDHGGRVLQHVQLVTISFAGYVYEPSMQAFGDWIVTSSWLTGLCSDYRCAAGAHLQRIVIPQQPPPVVTRPDIESFLTTAMQNGVVPRPPTHDNDWMYLVYYPKTTRIDAPGFTGCETDGYHWYVDDGQARWAYAPIPDCSAANSFGWTPIEFIEENASHELIEAITDPYPTAPAFELDDPANPWSTLYGEIGDLCVSTITQSGEFHATRAWSNSAASAGRDPCQPAPEDVYFNVGAPASVTVAAGGSVSFHVTAWSTAPRAAWHVLAVRGWQGSFDPAPRASATTVNNGDDVTVTATAPDGVASGAIGSVVLYSYDTPTGPYAMWPVLVHVQ
jgi:hypothetical protein